MKTKHPSLVLATSITTLLLGSLPVFAADSTWVGGTSTDWNDPTNWTAGLATDNVIVNTIPANIATISANPAVTQKDIFVGLGGGSIGRVDQTAGLVTTSSGNWMFIGQGGGTGTYNEANTAITNPVTPSTPTGFGLGSGSMTFARIYVGRGGNGTLNINTTGTIAVGNDFYVADGGTGVMNMEAGTINNTGGWMVIGQNAGSNGTVNMSGGTISTTGGQVVVGRNGGQGFFNMTAGTAAPALLTTTGELWIGQDAGSTGTMTVSAGAVKTANWLAVGRANSTGVLNISGTGSVEKTNATGALELGNAASSNGTVNLNGGSLIVNKVVTGGGTSTFNFNGGILKATVNEAAYMVGLTNAFVKAGGAVIDTAGFNTTIAQNLLTDGVSLGGGLTKQGIGTLTLSGASTYTGATSVQNGTLALTGTGSIAASTSIIVKQPAILDVSGVTGGFTLATGQTLGGKGTVTGNASLLGGSKLSPGESAGTLTFTNDLDISAAVAGLGTAALLFELGTPATSDLALLTTGILNFGSGLEFDDFVFTALGGFGPGTYTLFDTNNAIAGSLGAGVNGFVAGYSATLMVSGDGRDVQLFVVPEPSALVALLSGVAVLALRRRRRA